VRQIQTTTEKIRAFGILEDSFKDSLGMNWMIRNTKSHNSKKTIIRLMYNEAASKNGAFITDDNNGVVLFFQIQNKKFTFNNLCRAIFIFLFITGVNNGLKAIKYKKLIASIRPKSGWLGLLVATDQNSKDRVAAYEIKQEMFRIADEHNECIYLETTVPRVRVLYRAAGYIEYSEIKHPYADLTIWFFRRDPFTYSRNK
jgi:hypothetical protein